MYNATISDSYKHDKGERKETSSFSPTDLLVVAELGCQAFAKITELKQQGRLRFAHVRRPGTLHESMQKSQGATAAWARRPRH
jgi:uncharacterized OsmC-like protein